MYPHTPHRERGHTIFLAFPVAPHHAYRKKEAMTGRVERKVRLAGKLWGWIGRTGLEMRLVEEICYKPGLGDVAKDRRASQGGCFGGSASGCLLTLQITRSREDCSRNGDSANRNIATEVQSALRLLLPIEWVVGAAKGRFE